MKIAFNFLSYLATISLVFCQVYNVRTNYGAKGDGQTDDTSAIRSALKAVSNSNGGRVVFDAGYTFLTGAFNVTSNVILDIQGKILGSTNNANYAWTSTAWQPLIYSNGANNITITGGGTVDGQGAIWWQCSGGGGYFGNTSSQPCANKQRPMLVNLVSTNNVVIYNVTFQNSPMFNIFLDNVNTAHISQVNVLAPGSHDPNGPSHNTDGIDVANSQNVLVEFSYISVGDVALMAGSAYKVAENITFRYLNVGTSHGLAIGSYTEGGVQNVLFQNITMRGDTTKDHVDAGPMVISGPDRGGLVKNITYTNITLYNVAYCVTMNMNFSQSSSTAHVPQFQNININNLVCQNSSYGWTLQGLSSSAIQTNLHNIQFINVQNLNPTCQYTSGTCDSTVTPSCPSCIGSSG